MNLSHRDYLHGTPEKNNGETNHAQVLSRQVISNLSRYIANRLGARIIPLFLFVKGTLCYFAYGSADKTNQMDLRIVIAISLLG